VCRQNVDLSGSRNPRLSGRRTPQSIASHARSGELEAIGVRSCSGTHRGQNQNRRKSSVERNVSGSGSVWGGQNGRRYCGVGPTKVLIRTRYLAQHLAGVGTADRSSGGDASSARFVSGRRRVAHSGRGRHWVSKPAADIATLPISRARIGDMASGRMQVTKLVENHAEFAS
jgi:hypothetical protein